MAKKPRTYRDVAAKVVDRGTIGELQRRHVSTTLATVEAIIELSGADPQLVSAFAAHKEAVQIMQGLA